MADVMEFPEYWEDFIEDYSFKDDQHIYTNGSELIPVSRVKQMVDEYFSTGMKATGQAMLKEFRDGDYRVGVSENGCITLKHFNTMDDFVSSNSSKKDIEVIYSKIASESPKIKKRFVNDFVEVDEKNFITKECLDKMNKEIENFNKELEKKEF